MARGNEIIVSGFPRGTFYEGIIGDTSKPGTCMQIQAGTAAQGGIFTWVKATPPADGASLLIAILLPDRNQGKTATDAYVSGTRCFLYSPIAGEDLNVLIGGAGPTESFAIGDRLAIASNGNVDKVGNLAPPSSIPASVPFICQETVTAVTVPYLAWVKFQDQ